MHGALPSASYNSGPHDQFGFNPLPLIVPPGTEPNLQALNNPYIAAAHSHHVHSHFGSQSSTQAARPDMHTNHTIPIIDPALEVISKVSGTYPPMGGDVFKDSGEDSREDGTHQEKAP